MKLSPKYFRIRLVLLITPLMIFFFTFFNFRTIAKDYLTKKEDLNNSKLIIDRLYFNTYIDVNSRGIKKSHQCFDIDVKGQPYFIRLSEDLYSEKWEEIHTHFVSGDTLEIFYNTDLLQDTILYNPDELRINDRTIITYTDTKRLTLYIFIVFTAIILFLCFLFMMAYKTYKNELLDQDKILYQKNKWKLIGRWIGE